MRFGLAFIITGVALVAQSDGVACRPVLKPPSYPAAALEQKVTGVVVANVQVDSGNSLADLKVQGHPLLSGPTEQAVRQARFDAPCRNRHFAMQFHFVLDSAPAAATSATPIHYEIAGSSEPIVVTIASPSKRGKVRGFLGKLWCW